MSWICTCELLAKRWPCAVFLPLQRAPTLFVLNMTSVQAQGEWLGRVTAAWQRGALSNLHYLLYLNLAAGKP